MGDSTWDIGPFNNEICGYNLEHYAAYYAHFSDYRSDADFCPGGFVFFENAVDLVFQAEVCEPRVYRPRGG